MRSVLVLFLKAAGDVPLRNVVHEAQNKISDKGSNERLRLKEP